MRSPNRGDVRRGHRSQKKNEYVRDAVELFDYQEYVIKQLEWYEKKMKPSFEAAQRRFGELQGRQYCLARPEVLLRNEQDEPTALVCFDEASELFSRTSQR